MDSSCTLSNHHQNGDAVLTNDLLRKRELLAALIYTKMKKIILHIPHSSTTIPFYDGFTINTEQLEEELLLLNDWYTDDLFTHKNAITVLAGFSRIFCDVERFSDDLIEVMSKVGMGVLYEKQDNGNPLRSLTPELRNRIINEYYIPHHQKLTNAVEQQLQEYGCAVIIDCHSFPDLPFKRDLNQTPNRPDFNIGTDSFHTSGELLKTAQKFFKDRCLSLNLNKPYSGSIVPMKYYLKNKNVQTIMLEINRKLYLEGSTNRKTANYSNVKNTVNAFITEIIKDCLS